MTFLTPDPPPTDLGFWWGLRIERGLLTLFPPGILVEVSWIVSRLVGIEKGWFERVGWVSMGEMW